MIYFSLPFVPHSALCRQLLVLQGKDNENSSLYQTPFPGRQSPGISLNRRPGLWEPGSEVQGFRAHTSLEIGWTCSD